MIIRRTILLIGLVLLCGCTGICRECSIHNTDVYCEEEIKDYANGAGWSAYHPDYSTNTHQCCWIERGYDNATGVTIDEKCRRFDGLGVDTVTVYEWMPISQGICNNVIGGHPTGNLKWGCD